MESASLDERTGEERTQPEQVIGPRVLTIFIVGDILGAGIYALVGEAEPRSAGRSGRPSSSPRPHLLHRLRVRRVVALGAVLWLVNRVVEGPHEEVEPEGLRG